MTDARKTKGGARPGAGRPKETDPVSRVTVLLRAAQREKLRQFGGSEWVRRQIDASTPPASESSG